MNSLYSFTHKYLYMYIRNLHVYKGIGYESYIHTFPPIFHFSG